MFIIDTTDSDADATPPALPPKTSDSSALPPQVSNKPLPVNPPVGQTFRLSGTGTEVYMTNGGVANSDKKTMIILLTNSLGLSSSNNLYLADRFAETLKCTVAVPDLFESDPVTTGGAILDPTETNTKTEEPTSPEPSKPMSLLAQVKSFAVSTVKGFLEDMWSARHTFSHTLPLLQDTISELLAVYRPSKVAVVGYSFGAKYVLHLLSQAPPELPAGYDPTSWTASDDALREAEAGYSDEYENIMCGVVINPSLLDPKDFLNVAKPTHIIYSKDDDLLPESLIHRGLRLLESRKRQNAHIQGRVVVTTTIFDNDAERIASNNEVPPLPHGFAVPGDYPEKTVGDRPEKVFILTTSWIQERM